MKLQVTFGADKVLFVNQKTEKAEGFSYFEHMAGKDAVAGLRKEVDGRPNVSRAALSILVEVLQHERLQGYKGKTPLTEGIPKEFKQAMREVESAHVRPLFIASFAKTMDDGEKAKQADKYISEMWAGGVYSNVKAAVIKYFTQVGKLPCAYNADGSPDTGKLLSGDAINRLIENAKADARGQQSENDNGGIKDKYVRRLMAFMADFKERTSDDFPSADEVRQGLNAAKALLAEFEGMERHYAELRTRAGSSVKDTSNAIGKASGKAKAGTVKEVANA